MPIEVDFCAKSLVRSFSDTLMQDAGQSDDKSPSRKALEDALMERVGFEDSFAILLQGATTRYDTCTSSLEGRGPDLRQSADLLAGP